MPVANPGSVQHAPYPDAPGGLTREWGITFLLALLTFLTFRPALRGGFVNVDDYHIVVSNPHVTGGLTPAAIRWAFTNIDQGAYFPITWLSFQLDANLYGIKPWGFHLSNVLLHTANVGLLFWLLRVLTGSVWRSAALAAVFAVHPLRVESVAWVTERKDVLCVFFGLLTLHAYARYARRADWRRYACVYGLYVLCLMCKSMLVTLPCLLLLLDFWPLCRLGVRGVHCPLEVRPPATGAGQTSIRRLVLEKALMLAPALVIAAITTLGQERIGGVQSASEVKLDQRIANAFVSYVRYVEKMVRFDQLAVFYPFKPVSPVFAAASLLAITIITVLVLAEARRRPWLVTGWLWYLGTLVPMIGLVAVGGLAMADRFTYFPGIGLLIMLFWSAPDVSRSIGGKWVYAGSMVAVLAVLCIATRTQIGYWKNSRSLWEHDLRVVAPDAPILQHL